MNAKKTVTPTYTTALFVIWFVSKFTVSLLSYKNEPDMLIDVLFDYDFLMAWGSCWYSLSWGQSSVCG